MILTCVHCNLSFDESNFYKDKHKPTGRKPRCKGCDKLSINRDRRREYEKKYWSHPDRSERKKRQVKKSLLKNEVKHKEKRKEYLRTTAGINTQRKSGQATRFRKAGSFVENVDPLEVYHKQKGVCYMCLGKFTFKEMEMDHVIPLCKGGKHEKTNVKMCCPTCNKKKGAKLLSEVTYQMV